MLLFSLILIAWSKAFLTYNFGKLRKPSFKQEYESLYTTVDYFNPKAVKNTCLFLGRRFLIAFIIAFCGSSIVLQVLLADILSTLLLAFYLMVRPMIDSLNNKIQLFNEAAVLVCVWLQFH